MNGINSNELVRGLKSMSKDAEGPIAKMYSRLADRINQSHPDSITKGDVKKILSEPALRDLGQDDLDYAFKGMGFDDLLESKMDIFEAITQTLSPVKESRRTKRREFKQMNEDDISGLNVNDLANAFKTMTRAISSEAIELGSGKQSGNTVEFSIVYDNAFMSMIFEKISVKIQLAEAYVGEQAYIAMHAFDFNWTHTTGGRNGLNTKHYGIFKVESNGTLKFISFHENDKEAKPDLKKYGFL